MNNKLLVLVLLIAVLSISFCSSQDLIQIKGSDTMINLVQKLSEVYMEQHGGAAIAVTGGGSGVGIASLISDQVGIANSSREMKEKEFKMAEENGVVPSEFAIAIDALSIIVNSGNPVDFLTNDQIGAIFRGEINNWSEVGGPNLEISLYGRQPNSGTYMFFQEFILGNKDYSANMKQMNGNAQIVESIKTDKGAIGYVGVGYLHDDKGNVIAGLKVVEVAKDMKSTPVSPLISENIKSGLYPIARPLYQYTNGKPAGAVKDFLTFVLSDEGQKVVTEMGFYPVSGQLMEKNQKALF
ncbi:phosphate ABC transporter substrate-binding protein [candidate division KSB1 bacterium]|nr:phosphate ABC transporter substrate-binding protein [candidate division KSB1 bacterium]